MNLKDCNLSEDQEKALRRYRIIVMYFDKSSYSDIKKATKFQLGIISTSS